MTQTAILRSIQNTIEATQPRIKAAAGYAHRDRVLACRAELEAAVVELTRAIRACTRVLAEENASDRQLDLFRQAGAL